MTSKAVRLIVAAVGLAALNLVPQVVAAAKPAITLDVPANVTAGVVSAITIHLPKTVAAVDGRVLVLSDAAELIGVAPIGQGTALSPVAIADGYAFGAYGMAPVNGSVGMQLIVLPKVSGQLDVRVLLDALSDRLGRRLTGSKSALTGSLRVSGGGRHFGAPGGKARGKPKHSAGPVRPVFGRPQITVDDLDIVRAAWYSTRALSTSCTPGNDAAADANSDGCVDIVDIQAVLASQGTNAAIAGAPAGATTANSGSSKQPTAARSVSAAVTTPARTFTVTSTADTPDAQLGNAICADSTGACTLRAALAESSWQTGLTRIAFSLPGTAPVTIQLGSGNLPNLGTSQSSVFIDGYSQPGSRPNDAARGTNAIPGVEVRGASATNSQWIFYVAQAGNTIRGLLLDNAQNGVFLDGANSTANTIIGNWIGFNRDSSLPARGPAGVLLNNGAHNNVIGTPDPADRNVIGNADKAVYLNGPGTNANVVQNNVLCIKPDGATAICQTGIDVDFGPKYNLLGGPNANEGNVVGPNCCNGVELSHGWDPAGTDTSSKWQIIGNQVIGNWIGFRNDGHYDPAYRAAQSAPTYDNGQAVNVYDGSLNNLVQGNYIASAYDGVTVASANSTGNVIENNVIGQSPMGEPAPLAGWGIYLRWATVLHSLLGNRISNAAMGGIGLIEYTVARISISHNIIDSTSGPAIFFAPDPNDPTRGANDMLAGPSTSATLSSVSGIALPGATVEVYRASLGTGQTGLPTAFLGSAVADASGAWSLAVSLASGDRVTALQTRGDGTSSLLSPNAVASDAQSAPVASFTWQQTAQSMSVAFSDTSTGGPTSWSWSFGDGGNSTAQSPSHVYAGGGDYTVTLTATNPIGSSTSTQTVHVTQVASVFAADGFGRQAAGTWSSADLGGSYTLFDPGTSYNVGGGTGQMILPRAGNTRTATLAAVSATDVDVKVRFALDKAAAGGGQYVYAIVRSIGNSSYRPKVIVNPNGTITVHAGIVVNGTESSVAPGVTVAGLTLPAGSYMWLRAQVTGVNPTTIKVKAWRDGTAEPTAWQFSATNSAAALQAPGGVGLSAYIASSTSNAPVTVSFDDLVAVDPNGGSPTPPTASFTWSQQQNALAVDFTDHSTGAPTAWTWDFGDGTSSTQRNPTKTYSAAGPYSVTLIASNGLGQSSVTQTITVSAPVAITYATDAFGRNVSGGWGSADVGGAYSDTGTSALNVANGVGTITPPRAGSTRGVTLTAVSARDVSILVRIAVDKVPTGSIVWAYEVARSSGNNEYRPKILLKPDGTVAVHAGVVISDAESPIGQPVTVPGLTYSAGTFIWLRANVTGANPTTIKVRAWLDGQAEPTDWQYAGTNSASAVQSAGAVGLRVYTNTTVTNAPVTVSFDDYAVTDPNGAPPPTGTAVLVGTGDIGVCGSSHPSETAAVIAGISGTVFTAGDNAYPDGSATDFANCYDPTWGAFKARTRPAPGNHEFGTDHAATAYFAYFGSNAGPPGRGYYFYDAGAWRVYALNSECWSNGSCTAQYNWLQTDLISAPHQCVMAIWHRPRFSTGPEGQATDLSSFFQLLYDRGVDLLISGHSHMYERMAPANGSGVADPMGVRQIVIGTGGAPLYTPTTTNVLLEAFNATTYGVLRLDLAPGSYTWHFLPAASGTYTDSGTTACH